MMFQRSILEALFQALRATSTIDRGIIFSASTDASYQKIAEARNSLQDITYFDVDTPPALAFQPEIVTQVLTAGNFVVTKLPSTDLAAVDITLTDATLPNNADETAQTFPQVLCLPLKHQNQLLGAIYLEKVAPTHGKAAPWSTAQIDLLQAISTQAALSISYSRDDHRSLADNANSSAATTLTFESTSQQLRTSRTFRQIVEHANDVIFMITLDGRFTYLSPKFKELVGAEPEKYLDQPFTQIAHPDDIERMYSMLQLQLRNQTQLNGFEFRLRREDGAYIWAAANNSAPLADESGNPIGFQGSVRDINTRKLAEQELQRTQARLQFLLATTPAIIHSVSLRIPYSDPANHTITFISDNVTQTLGYEIDELHGPLANWLGKIHPEDRDRAWSLYCQTITDCSSSQTEYRLQNQAGEYQWVYSSIKVLLDASGNPSETVGYTADITARKLTEAQLLKTNEQLIISNSELARATRLKDEFLANMSHELRTPLNAILGISEAMQEEFHGTLSEQYRKSLKIIEQSGTHLLELINDILDLAKIEAGKLEVKPSSISLQYLCDSSLSFVRQIAVNKQIKLIHPELGQDLHLCVDERRMRQVLINLLSNAVKFTPSGGVVELRATYNDDDQTFEFQVSDTGIGIAPDNLSQLFQPFLQIDSSLSREFSGTGLGLTLVKRIVELHQGEISVESQVNQGSCFTICLPIVPSQVTPPIPTPPAPPVVEKSVPPLPLDVQPVVLLAEDNAMNIDILRDYLHSQRYEVIVANNGIEAIELAQTQHPHLILMDIQMPRMDGLEATRRIRQNSDLVDIPIIALTALAMRGDAARCRAAGATDYLSKPVKLKKLAALMAQYLVVEDD